MALVAVDTGMRLGELLGLHWSDLNLEERRVVVRHSFSRDVLSSPKNNRERIIPLTEEVCAVLGPRRRKAGLVFDRGDGRPLNRWSGVNALHHASKCAGLTPIGWHILRHTFASHLVRERVDLPAVQALLGHSTITMTMRYAHVAPSTLAEAVWALEKSNRRRKLGNWWATPPPRTAPRWPAIRVIRDQILAKSTQKSPSEVMEISA